MKASKGEDIQPSQIKRIYAKAPPRVGRLSRPGVSTGAGRNSIAGH